MVFINDSIFDMHYHSHPAPLGIESHLISSFSTWRELSHDIFTRTRLDSIFKLRHDNPKTKLYNFSYTKK